jgi:hypothetical protein
MSKIPLFKVPQMLVRRLQSGMPRLWEEPRKLVRLADTVVEEGGVQEVDQAGVGLILSRELKVCLSIVISHFSIGRSLP